MIENVLIAKREEDKLKRMPFISILGMISF